MPVGLAVLVVLVAAARHHGAAELALLGAVLILVLLEARYLARAFVRSPAGSPTPAERGPGGASSPS